MRVVLLLLGALIVNSAYAHGPTPRKTDESVVVKGSLDIVWKKVSEPCAIVTWHPQVKSCEVVSDKQQKVTLSNDKTILVEVDEVADAEKTISFRLGGEIDIAALPVSSFNGRIKVNVEGDATRVSWMARYYRAFTGNEPPEGQDDETAQAAVDAFVKAGLDNLAATSR